MLWRKVCLDVGKCCVLFNVCIMESGKIFMMCIVLMKSSIGFVMEKLEVEMNYE